MCYFCYMTDWHREPITRFVETASQAIDRQFLVLFRIHEETEKASRSLLCLAGRQSARDSRQRYTRGRRKGKTKRKEEIGEREGEEEEM